MTLKFIGLELIVLFFFFYERGYPSQFVRILTNLIDPEVNDHVSL
jgi:hypothetical protein